MLVEKAPCTQVLQKLQAKTLSSLLVAKCAMPKCKSEFLTVRSFLNLRRAFDQAIHFSCHKVSVTNPHKFPVGLQNAWFHPKVFPFL